MTDRSPAAISLPPVRHPASWWLPVAAALVAIVFRLPFLQRSEGFFGTDEAIIGLMARHIGDVPVFVWGQPFQGVPHVYLAAVVFALFGAGVLQLKAATLAVWAVAVALTTRLGQRWYGNFGGAVTGALLATGSPALVTWSLSGSAEIAWLTLIFSGVLLAYQRSVDSPDRPIGAVVFFGCGAALWIDPIAMVFITTLALVAASRSTWWRQHGWAGVPDAALGRNLRGAARVAAVALHVLLLAVAAIFVVTYLGGRINVGVVTAANPQKVFRWLTDLGALVIVYHALTGVWVPRRRALAAMGWFALGLLPVALHVARGGQAGVTAPVHHLGDLPAFFHLLWHDALPIAAGVKNTVSDWIVPWWYAAGFVAALLLHAAVTCRASLRFLTRGIGAPSQVFAGVAAVALFVLLGPGGMFLDLHLYRDLLPFFGLAVLSAASGARAVWVRSRRAGGLLAAACLCGFLAEDARWVLDLQPNPSD